MKKITIITDSGCDLDLDILEKIDVKILPFEIRFDDELFLDRVSLSPSDFYKKLSTFGGVPKTSLVTPGMFVKAFEEALVHAENVIYIGFSSKLSGTFQAAILAKNILDLDSIDVFDTKGASAVQALLIIKAVEMIEQGKLKDEILDSLNKMIEKTHCYFAVGNLEMLRRGGRLSNGVAFLGSVLNIKPILQFDDEGSIIPFEKVRGNKAVINEFIDLIRENADNIQSQVVCIAHSGDDTYLSEYLKDELKREFGVKNFLVTKMGGAIGSHVGEGTVGVAFLGK